MTKSRGPLHYFILVFGLWAGLILLAATFMATRAPDPIVRALFRMVCGLGYVWIVAGGITSWLWRDRIRTVVQSINLDWRLKFILFATLMAMLEEVVTTTMTNLAPVFGVRMGAVYITASGNYLDVVLFHSVIVLIPEFIAWAWLLSRYDFSPGAVFLLYGLTGTLGETLAFGPQNIGMLGFWMFVYGLMVYLPAYTIPSDRSVQKPGVLTYLSACVLPFLPVIPVVLAITKGFHHPGFHFPPIHGRP